MLKGKAKLIGAVIVAIILGAVANTSEFKKGWETIGEIADGAQSTAKKAKEIADKTGVTDAVTDAIDKAAKSSTVTNDGTGVAEGIPEFSGNAYYVINDNNPSFSEVSSDYYFQTSELDSLGRCGQAKALVGPDSITSEERGSIGMIKPSGWHTVRYDNLISDKYLYNRGHLIMFKLWGNETNINTNLITETRYANATTQLYFENQILEYIYDTGAIVEYHVTPDFQDDELVARGVELEALSSDGGLKLHVYIYNVQPGIQIDYATGDSWEDTSVTVYSQ